MKRIFENEVIGKKLKTVESNQEQVLRLKALFDLRILDSGPEKEFDDLAILASVISGSPIVLLSFMDDTREWVKACVGVATVEIDLRNSFCVDVVLRKETIQIEDVLAEERTCQNHFVTNSPNVRFYAGIPLVTSSGYCVGALSIFDTVPKCLSGEQLRGLQLLADQIIRSLETRGQVMSLLEMNQELAGNDDQVRTNLEYISELQLHLESKERQYRELVEGATDMIYELDEHGRFAYVNPVMETKCRYTKSELTEKKYWEIIHPDFVKSVTLFYETQRKNRQVSTYHEFPIFSKTNEEIWVGQNVKMHFTDKWVTKVSVVARDITTVYKTRNALLTSEKRFKSLAENSPVAIYQTDKNNRIVYSNYMWDKIFGIDEELLSSDYNFLHVFHEDREKVSREWKNVRKNHLVFNQEYRINNPVKGVRWIVSSGTPIYDNNKSFIGFIGTVSDITERKDAEMALQAEKVKAEDATKAKSQFLSVMSHEIRTPLNGVIGLTNLILQDHPKAEHLESLQLLKFSGDNLLAIINDILDFSKIEAGKIELENIDFDLFSLAQNVKKMLEFRAKEKGIEIGLSYDPTLPAFVKGDPVRITQVITNLLGNAVKFTSKGSVQLIIKLKDKIDEGYEVSIAIEDTGIGIPKDKISSIFESFSQAGADTTRKFGGTGLGLSITKRLLDLMGTSIQVESDLGIGSTFSFTLLLPEGTGKVEPPQNDYLDNFKDQNVKVLLVDDNPVNVLVASRHLRKWGIFVDTAESGQIALDKILSKSYHLVLMDLIMPEMDGYETSLKIRSFDDQYFKEVPIIALTASSINEIREKAHASGMNDFISKPFQPEDLKSKVALHAVVLKDNDLKKS